MRLLHPPRQPHGLVLRCPPRQGDDDLDPEDRAASGSPCGCRPARLACPPLARCGIGCKTYGPAVPHAARADANFARQRLPVGLRFRWFPAEPAGAAGSDRGGSIASGWNGCWSIAPNNPQYGDDSYWGGKDLLRFAQYVQMARELKSPSYARLRELSRKSLADWLTYTPGEKAHYFTRYENWHALIGIKDSYDSARFNDQHFHYGYLTLSAALLGMEDPQFLADYAGMLRLVAKQYANWDRKDRRFPLLRTFDIWAGHSWAGGLGSPGGNNQESSSEAMQSWIGLYLLGTLLDDAEMTAAAAMGYAMESRATMEYWFDLHGDILPPEYKHPIVGVLWSGGQVYGTYFSGDPGWIYGIQCLPQSPGLDYLVRDPQFAAKAFRTALAARKAKDGQRRPGRHGRPRQRAPGAGLAGRSRVGDGPVRPALGGGQPHRAKALRRRHDLLQRTRLSQPRAPAVERPSRAFPPARSIIIATRNRLPAWSITRRVSRSRSRPRATASCWEPSLRRRGSLRACTSCIHRNVTTRNRVPRVPHRGPGSRRCYALISCR